MKPPWNDAAGAAAGAAWLLDELAPCGALGRAARERDRFFAPGDEAAAREAIADVARVAIAVDPARLAALRAALAAAPDPMPSVVRARAGGVLGDVEFFDLARFLDALADARALGAGGLFEGRLPPDAADLRAILAPGRNAERAFYLADAFDERLARARDEAARRQADYDLARSRLGERIARYAGVERVRDGEFVLMRDALVMPVPAEIRVVRETQTYLLCDVSLDQPALDALAARDAATGVVAEAEELVRSHLSAAVAAAADVLARAAAACGKLDLFTARVAFAQRYACVVPDVAESTEISFTDARFLPLAATLDRHARRYAPISLDLSGIGVVTGPNMGGKTAALRTCGFLAACVTAGVPVPAASARIALFDEIAWLGIDAEHVVAAGDEGLLSAFGLEVVGVRTFFARSARRPLVLVDEFARTTSPVEGRALLVALLETLRARGALAFAATHLANVQPNGGAMHFAIGGLGALPPRGEAPLDLEAALAHIASAMDYSLRSVSPDVVPDSGAVALAEALGLDADLISRARTHL